MKRGLRNLNHKERQRILDNFYSKEIKKGKTMKADILDKIAMGILVFVLINILFNKLIGNFVTSLVLSVLIMVRITKIYRKAYIKQRKKQIEKIKFEYKSKLEEEKVLTADDDIEDYMVSRYYEKRAELKSNINFLNKDKIIKLYILFVVLYLISYFSTYSTYYKIMAIISFIIATGIGSYNITEYISHKGKSDLLNNDIDV